MMISTVSIFVISLVSAEQRRQHIISEFKKYDINFNFYDAITPDKINFTAQDIGIDVKKSNLTQGEMACLLSHVMLWKKAVDSNLDYITIFEDDVYLGEDANIFLSNFSWIPRNIQIIKLEAFDKKVDLSFLPKFLGNGRYLYRLESMHLGGAGYILSQKAAKSLLLSIIQLPELKAVDHILFEDYLKEGDYKVYQMIPAICVQDFYVYNSYDNFPSHLEADRAIRLFKPQNKRIQKHKVNLLFKIKREFLRFLFQILKMKKFSAYRRIKFK